MSLFDKMKKGLQDSIDTGKKAIDNIDTEKLKEDIKTVGELVEDKVKKAAIVVKDEFDKVDWVELKNEAINYGKQAGTKVKSIDIDEIKEMAKNKSIYLSEDFLNKEVMPKVLEKYPEIKDIKLQIEEGSISIVVSSEVKGIIASMELNFTIEDAAFIGSKKYVNLIQTSEPEISFDIPAGDLLGRVFGRIIVRALRGKMEKAVELSDGAVTIDADRILINLESLEIPKEASFVLKVIGITALIPEQKEKQKGRLKVQLGFNK